MYIQTELMGLIQIYIWKRNMNICGKKKIYIYISNIFLLDHQFKPYIWVGGWVYLGACLCACACACARVCVCM